MFTLRGLRLLGAWALLCWGFATTAAWASGLQISPVGLSLPVDQRASAFRLGNIGQAPLTAQVRVFRWTQNEAGEDVLTPSDALVVSPPMVRIDAQRQQQFRIIRAQPAGSAEEAYRVIVDELPLPNAASKGLQLVLRYSVPVFLNTEENPEPTLQWRLEPAPGGQSVLVVRNTGSCHAQIGRIWLDKGPGKQATFVNDGLLGYVLPASTLRRVLPASPQALRAGTFTVTVNARDIQPSIEWAAP